MEQLDELLAEALRESLVEVVNAGLAAGPLASPAFMVGASAMLKRRLERVWTLPADPDEWLRPAEAACLRAMIAVVDGAQSRVGGT